jgi:hypothetical protein
VRIGRRGLFTQEDLIKIEDNWRRDVLFIQEDLKD